jgi:hypothetical protein
MTIEVFKTDVHAEELANELKAMLQRHFPGSHVNFDLDDRDKVLRMEGMNFTADKVVLLVKEKGVACHPLE